MKKLISLAAIALALCIAFVSCTKDETGGTVIVNGETYTNVTATVNTEGRGLWFHFTLDKDKGITATSLIDDGIALQKTLKYGVDEGNGGYGDWIALDVDYGNRTYTAVPASGTQTIKKGKKDYTILAEGKDENGKAFKIDVTATIE